MKRLILAAIIASLTTVASAKEVVLSTSSDDSYDWIGYDETFTVHSDNTFTVMMSRRTKNRIANDVRFFAGVTEADCKKGFGTYYMKQSVNGQWEVSGIFNITSPHTNSDHIAAALCEAGAEYRKKSAPTRKKSTT